MMNKMEVAFDSICLSVISLFKHSLTLHLIKVILSIR